MAIAAVTLFYRDVITWVNWVIFWFTLAIEVFAIVHCLTQRAEAFPAIGTLSKPAWIGLIAGTALLAVLLSFGPLGIFSLIAAGVAAVYVLDVRPALRDVTDGRGNW
jgi:hypothetical protein